jgi:tetratricopeptide (TPR) repeat protein
LEQKLNRGNFGAASWSRKRYDLVNIFATIKDTAILQNIETLFTRAEIDGTCLKELSESVGLLEKMAVLARSRHPASLEFTPCAEMALRVELAAYLDFSAQFEAVKKRGDLKEKIQWLQKYIRLSPKKTSLYTDLALLYLNLNDLEMAWQVLSQAWQIAPNSFYVLSGMAYYFLKGKNFVMAEKTCYLLLEMAPHDVTALACMTEAMLRQERWDAALKIGVPLVELASIQGGGLLGQMGPYLVKKMAGYLLEKKDFAGAAHLWEAWSQCQPDEINPLLELANALFLTGDQIRARQVLAQAQAMAPQNEAVLALLNQVGPVPRPRSSVLRRSKRH